MEKEISSRKITTSKSLIVASLQWIVFRLITIKMKPSTSIFVCLLFIGVLVDQLGFTVSWQARPLAKPVNPCFSKTAESTRFKPLYCPCRLVNVPCLIQDSVCVRNTVPGSYFNGTCRCRSGYADDLGLKKCTGKCHRKSDS